MNEIYDIYRKIRTDCTTHLEVQNKMIKDYGYTWQEITEAKVAMEANEPNYWVEIAKEAKKAFDEEYEKWSINDATPAQWDAIRAEADPLKYQVGGDHYTKMKIQPVEYIHANKMDFMDGCIVGYISRWRDKGGVQDLNKIKQFVDLIIKLNKL